MSYGDNAYIYLRKKILDWQWYNDTPTRSVFIHCLLRASWKDAEYKGIRYGRGQLIDSNEKIAEDLGISIQNVKTAIKHLKRSGELTSLKIGKHRIITVVKYDMYQQPNLMPNLELTSNQPETNLELTSYKEIKEDKEVNEVKNNNPPISPLGDREGKKAKNKTDTLTPKEAQEKINEIIDNSELSTPVKEKLKEFVEYKRSEIKKPYKSPKRFCSVELKNTIECEKKNGTDATVNCIDDCMGHGYQGLFFNNAYRYAKEKPKHQAFNAAEFLKRYEE